MGHQESKCYLNPIKKNNVRNSKNFKKLSLDLSNGIWPKGCWSCKESEEKNVSSMRQDFEFLSNKKFEFFY